MDRDETQWPGRCKATTAAGAGTTASSSIDTGELAVVAGLAATCCNKDISCDADKDRIILAQAKRIALLEQEADKARRERDALATKLALLSHKLNIYCKEDRHSQRPEELHTSTALDTMTTSCQGGCSSEIRISSVPCTGAFQHRRSLASATDGIRTLSVAPGYLPPSGHKPPQVTMASSCDHCCRKSHHHHTKANNVQRASPPNGERPPQGQGHHYLQKRTSEEDDKIKRSRDWDYELSQDLRAKQIEMLEKKYGGVLRASRAARIIQHAYRQYSLNKNFAKLRLEIDKRRLSRRFTDTGRSKMIWMDVAASPGSVGASQVTIPLTSERAVFSQSTLTNNEAVTNSEQQSSKVKANSKATASSYDSYYVKVLQKSHTMTVTMSEERSVHREQRFVGNSGMKSIHEINSGLNYDSDGASESINSYSRVIPVHSYADYSSSSSGSNTNSRTYYDNGDHDLSVQLSYMDQQDMMDNNVDYENVLSGNIPHSEEGMDEEFSEHPLSRSAYMDSAEDIEHNIVGENYCGSKQIDSSKLQQSSQQIVMPTNNLYSSLRLCSFRRNPQPGNIVASHLENMKAYESPVWKRKVSPFDPSTASYDNVNYGVFENFEYANNDTTPSSSAASSDTASNGSTTGLNQSSYTPVSSCVHNISCDLPPFPNQYVSRPKVSDKQRKRTYRIGLNLFNKKPEKGILYLIDRHFLDNRPNAVARFLIARKGLSKQMIGEYLGNLQKQFNMEVLRCFAEEIDLRGLQIDVALRKFQSYFRMPGEAQKIERLMEAFASQYCECNPEMAKTFHRPDTVFLLAFATIMLNTDLHNKNIKPDRKMKLADFIRNLRGIDDGEDVDPNLLAGMYERIREGEFSPGTDHVSQVARVEQMIVGKKPPLAVLHRRLVCYCRLFEVQDPNKREKLNLHQREVFLFNDMLMVTKLVGKRKNAITYSFRSTFALSGMAVYLFQTPHYKYGIRLTNESSKATILLNARNELDRTKFVEDLKEAILEMNEMEALRIEEELQKQQLKQKHCNYNRHSKDSGVVDIELLRPSEFGSNRHSTVESVVSRVNTSPSSLVDLMEYGHRGSAGSLDSGLVSIHT